MKNILRLLTGYKTPISRTPNFFAPAYRTGRPLRLCALIFLCAFAPLRDISAQKAIHELPAKTTIDTNYLFIQGNPTTGKLYKTRGAALNAFISGGGGTATDTTSLSNRIDLKLNISDTTGLSNRIDAIGPHIDTTSLSNRIDAIPTISSFSKNAGRDSTILLLSSGTRYAVKDSIGAGGGGGSQTLDQVLTEGNTANLLYTDVNYKYTNWVVPSSTPLNSTFGVNIKKITPSEYGTDTTVGLWSETIGEYQSGQEGSPTARKNVVWSWGYNIDQDIANEGYMRFGMESNYRPGGGAEWFEWHAPEVLTRDGLTRRWYSVIGSKASPNANHIFQASTFKVLDVVDGTTEYFGFDGSNWGIKGDYIGFTNKLSGKSSFYIQTTGVDLILNYGTGTDGNVFENYGTATRYITSTRNNFGGQVWTDKYFNANTVASQKIYAAANGAGDIFTITANAANTGVSAAFYNSAFFISAEDGSSNPLFRVLSNSYANYFNVYNDGHVTIGTASPAASSILDITSTTKGVLLPRMTTTQVNAISSPAEGLIAYDLTTHTPKYHNGTDWVVGGDPVATFSKNATRDSIILTLTSGTRFAVKDSIGSGGGGGGIGGNTGATDNSLLRSDGTGGATMQNSAITVDDNGNITMPKAFGVNTTISFSDGFGNPALRLYDGGSTVRYEWGLQASEMQFAIPSSAHYSWNKGGDLQTSGTNELMRLDAATGSLLLGTASTDASSILTVVSTTKGFLPPRMTKTQRDAISSPATGLVIYQTDNTPGLRCYNGTNWIKYSESTD